MSTIESIKSLVDKSKDYLDTKIELTKLKAVDTSADVLSSLIVLISVILTSFLCILFTSVGLAILIGKKMGALQTGFFIVGGIYAVILGIIFVQRERWIKKPITNGLINKMLK